MHIAVLIDTYVVRRQCRCCLLNIDTSRDQYCRHSWQRGMDSRHTRSHLYTPITQSPTADIQQVSLAITQRVCG